MGNREQWTARRFSQIVAELGPAAVNKKPTNYRRALHGASGVPITYERFRQQVEGEDPPQPYIMEAVARVLGLTPDAFLEYRIWQVGQVMTAYPEQSGPVYEVAMLILKREEASATSG